MSEPFEWLRTAQWVEERELPFQRQREFWRWWVRFDPPARAWRSDQGLCYVADLQGWFRISPSDGECVFEAHSSSPDELRRVFLQHVVADHLWAFAERFPETQRLCEPVLQPATGADHGPLLEFRWDVGDEQHRTIHTVRYDPTDRLIRHYERITEALSDGELTCRRIHSGFLYNLPLPDEVFQCPPPGMPLVVWDDEP